MESLLKAKKALARLEAARAVRAKCEARPRGVPVRDPVAVARPVSGDCSLDLRPAMKLQFPYVGTPTQDDPTWRQVPVGKGRAAESYMHTTADWRPSVPRDRLAPAHPDHPGVAGRTFADRIKSAGRVPVTPNRGRNNVSPEPLPSWATRKGPPAPNRGRQAFVSFGGEPAPAPRRKTRKTPSHVFALARVQRLGAAYAWLRQTKGTNLEPVARRNLDDVKQLVCARDYETLNRRLP